MNEFADLEMSTKAATSTAQPDINNDNYKANSLEIRLMVFFFILTTGLLMNISLLLLFVTKHKFAVAYHRLVNLVLSNSIACIFIIMSIISLLTSHHIFNIETHCVGIEAVTEAWWVSQNVTVTCISYSRYRCISKPERYPNAGFQDDKCRIITYVSVIWCITFTMVALLFTPDVITTYDKEQKMCRRHWEKNIPYTIVHVLVSFIIPAFALFFSHIYMLRECYLKQKIMKFPVSGMKLPAERTIHADQYGAAMKRSVSTDWSMFKTGREGSSACSLSERSSQRSFSEINAKRKGSLRSKSIRKSLRTILLIFGSYLLASVPQLIVIICYVTGYEVGIHLGGATISKFTLVVTFPYIFGPHSRTIKKELLIMCRRIRCWKSNKIVPSLNIDEKDYTINVMRRDSRRSSLASRKNSMNDVIPPPPVPPLTHTIFVRTLSDETSQLEQYKN